MRILWKTGNIAKLMGILDKSDSDNPEAQKRFFADRNIRWIPQIETFLRQDKVTLVIAGAGHFVGDNGVVRLLRERGYAVTQLPNLPSFIPAIKILQDRSVELNFALISGHNYAVEASTNLLAWDPIYRFVSSDSTRSYVDRLTANASFRFYRLRNLD